MYKYGTNIYMSLSDALRGRDGYKVGEDKKRYTNEEIMEAWILFFMSEYNKDGN